LMATTDGEREVFKAGELEIQINLDFFQSNDAIPARLPWQYLQLLALPLRQHHFHVLPN
jgi:hypothetical protein